MKTYLPLGILLAACLLLSSHAQDKPAPADTPQAPSAKIQALRNDQIAALQEAHRSLRVLHEVGKASFTDVAAIHQKLLESQLAAAKTREARLHSLREMLKNAEQLEKLTETQFKEGVGTVSNYQLARAARLEIQIKIEQENE